MTKVCIHCGKTKELENFYYRKDRGKYMTACKVCHNLQNKARYVANPRKVLDANRITRLRRDYGLTTEDFDTMVTKQNNQCGICGIDLSFGIGPCVDHCHTTGKVRGLLCQKCNSGVGLLNDDPKILRAAIDYLGG